MAGKFARGLFVVAFTSGVAGLATAPISAFHFNQIAQYGLLANVLAVPIMGFVIMPAAIIGILVAPLGMSGPAFWVTGKGIDAVLQIANWVANLDNALLFMKSGPDIALGACALGGVALAIFIGRARIAGVAVFLFGISVWFGSERPDILIDPSARLAGVKTPGGRMLARSRGAGYAASTWLENDGDPVSQSTAAKRLSTLPEDTQSALLLDAGFVLATGKRALSCADNVIVFALQDISAHGDCRIFDKSNLQKTGSVAVWLTEEGPRIVKAADRIGRRLWVQSNQ